MVIGLGIRAHAQVLLDRHARKGDGGLRDVGDPGTIDPARRQPGDNPALECDTTGPAGQQPGDGLQQHALAGAVGADDRNHLARFDLQGQRVQDFEPAVARTHIFKLELHLLSPESRWGRRDRRL